MDPAVRQAGLSDRSRDALLALAVALLALCLHAWSGFLTLAGGDNDSLLRLVQVRDLIGGQGWFDLHQYRMGPAGGFVMHWSRLVDAPIAALTLAATAVTGSMAAGETVARVGWPLMLMALAMFFLLRLARAVGGDRAVLPVLTIGAAALHFVGIFAPGNIDHHNVQLVLTLAAITALAAPASKFSNGAAAGACVALMLAVGMEALPYVAVAGLYVALRLLAGGRSQAVLASGFGAAFWLVAAAAFVATVPAGQWRAAECDAFSLPQLAIAAIGGAGLMAAAGVAALRQSLAMRFAALAAVGVVAAAAIMLSFPQCLADPYAGLDPRLRMYWLSAIIEAQPVWSVLKYNPAMAAGYYVTPVIGLLLLFLKLGRDGVSRPALLVAAFLAAAVAVSAWQVRGSMFAIPLATIPLAAWVGSWRRRAAAGASSATLGMALAWLVSLNVAWSASANAIAAALGGPLSPAAAQSSGSSGSCDNASDLAALAALPATTVLAISNLGAPILAHTHHRVLSGPYHRNVAGNLLALQAFMGSDAQALAIAGGNGVGLVVLCRGNDETGALSQWAPSGFIASLASATVPRWLARVPGGAGETLEIYRFLKQP